MAEDVILAIDQGTTGSKALLLNSKGIVLSSHTIEFKQIFPQSDFVEHNPEDIWSSVSEAIKKTIQKAKIDARNIKCIGITNQRETTVIWDKKTKQTLTPKKYWM